MEMMNTLSCHFATIIQYIKINGKDCAKILFVIGPEGGFTDNEEKTLIDNGFVSTSFGSRVLRTETASLYVLSVLNYISM